jgi:chaperonin GroES
VESSSPIPPRKNRSRARCSVGAGAPDETGRIIPLAVKAGDRVLFGKWTGAGVLIEGEERLILKEADIFGVIEGKMWAAARAA